MSRKNVMEKTKQNMEEKSFFQITFILCFLIQNIKTRI